MFIVKLLHWVLSNNYVSFNGSLYLQISGTAMGTNVAPVYAQLVMYAVEIQHYRNFLFYLRYIDDIIAVASTEETAQTTINALQNVWPTIKLNSIVIGKQSSFLDLNIMLTEEGKFNISIYQKPQNIYQYIPASSSHPPSMLKAFVYNELRRYRTTSTTEDQFTATAQSFHSRIRNRGYSSDIFDQALQFTVNKFPLLQSPPGKLTHYVPLDTLLSNINIMGAQAMIPSQPRHVNFNQPATLSSFKDDNVPTNKSSNQAKQLVIILFVPGISYNVKWRTLFKIPEELLNCFAFQFTYRNPTNIIIAKRLEKSIHNLLINSKFC